MKPLIEGFFMYMKQINEEDSALFRSTVNNNTPIDKDKTHQPNHANKQEPFKAYSYITEANLLGADVVKHAQSGVSSKIIKKMKRDNIEHIPVLDLHGQSVVEACESMSQFIYHHQKKSLIHIIHGKGYHSEHGMSVLKTQVVSFLKQHPSVMAFNSCPDKDGGTGAVFVLMRKA